LQTIEYALNAIGKFQNTPMDTLKSHVCAHLCGLTDSTIAYFGSMNAAEDTMTIIGFSSGAMVSCRMVDKPLVYPLSAVGIWGDAIRERRATIYNDYEGLVSPTTHGHPEGPVKVRRYLGVPIWNGRKIVMLVGLGNKKEPYTQDDVKAVEAFMAQVHTMAKATA